MINDLSKLTKDLLASGEAVDEDAWPESLVAVMREAGCFAGVVPKKHGGLGATSTERLLRYEATAAGSLVSALVLTQHDAAGELLAQTANDALASRVLPGCAAGDLLLTVGISQLTTSRRGGSGGGRPAMVAQEEGEGFVLDGFMPWVTSAGHADQVLTGGVLADGRQVLMCLPFGLDGICIDEPARLLALSGSCTCQVRCASVHVPAELIVRGPVDDVLQRRAPVKSLSVTFVALGVAGALVQAINECPTLAGELADGVALGVSRYEDLKQRLYEQASDVAATDAGIPRVALRSEANDLVGRLARTLMVLAKGTGYLLTHRAQRLLREAAFFLVWSAPPSVQSETVRRIWT